MEFTDSTYTNTRFPYRQWWSNSSYTSPDATIPCYYDAVENHVKTIAELSKNVKSSRYKPNTIYCMDKESLSSQYVLKLIEIMKNKLIVDTSVRGSTRTVDHIECRMTESVKNTIITAWKKQHSYGKSSPFIPRFDKYGEELPTVLNVAGGMNIKIFDANDDVFDDIENCIENYYIEDYIELEAIMTVAKIPEPEEQDETKFFTVDGEFFI